MSDGGVVGEIDLVRAGGRPKHLVVLLTALVIAYPLVPQGGLRQICFSLLGAACVAMGLWGAGAIRTAARTGWVILLAGFGTMVLGDAVFSLEQAVFHVGFYPAPSDAVYLTAYVLLVVGMLRLVTGRRGRRDPVPLLDSAIVAVGAGIVVVTFFITPQAGDSSLNLAGRAVASAYPGADVLLMATLARIWNTASARSTACRLLLLSLGATLVADIGWDILALADPQADTPAWMDVLWLVGYVCAGTAACTHSAASLSGRAPEVEAPPTGVSPLVATACLLPGLTLLVDGLSGEPVSWLVISTGSVALAVLVLLRLRLLLRAVAAQAAQLSAAGITPAVVGADADQPWEIELRQRSGMSRD